MSRQPQSNKTAFEFALTKPDSSGEEVLICDASPKERYYCPYCFQRMVPRQGNCKSWGFAHAPNTMGGRDECLLRYCKSGLEQVERLHRERDLWQSVDDLWFREMKSRFANVENAVLDKTFDVPEEQCRIRADVFIETENTRRAVEFYTTNIPKEALRRRNREFQKQGILVSWIYDVSDLFEQGNLTYLKPDSLSETQKRFCEQFHQKYYRIYPSDYSRYFDTFLPHIETNISVYFWHSFRQDNKEHTRLRKLMWCGESHDLIALQRVGEEDELLVSTMLSEEKCRPYEEIQLVLTNYKNQLSEKRKKEQEEQLLNKQEKVRRRIAESEEAARKRKEQEEREASEKAAEMERTELEKAAEMERAALERAAEMERTRVLEERSKLFLKKAKEYVPLWLESHKYLGGAAILEEDSNDVCQRFRKWKERTEESRHNPKKIFDDFCCLEENRDIGRDVLSQYGELSFLPEIQIAYESSIRQFYMEHRNEIGAQKNGKRLKYLLENP